MRPSGAFLGRAECARRKSLTWGQTPNAVLRANDERRPGDGKTPTGAPAGTSNESRVFTVTSDTGTPYRSASVSRGPRPAPTARKANADPGCNSPRLYGSGEGHGNRTRTVEHGRRPTTGRLSNDVGAEWRSLISQRKEKAPGGRAIDTRVSPDSLENNARRRRRRPARFNKNRLTAHAVAGRPRESLIRGRPLLRRRAALPCCSRSSMSPSPHHPLTVPGFFSSDIGFSTAPTNVLGVNRRSHPFPLPLPSHRAARSKMCRDATAAQGQRQSVPGRTGFRNAVGTFSRRLPARVVDGIRRGSVRKKRDSVMPRH